MKRFICLLLLFFFMYPMSTVNAAKYETTQSEDDYKITYDISQFKIDGNNITIKGFSALSHIDNYGGQGGNMKTSIIAYIPETGKSKSYTADYDSRNSVDLYYLRCAYSNDKKDACNKDAQNFINNSIAQNTKIVEANTCSEIPEENTNFSGAHCAYHNLGFTITLSINQIIKDLGITKSSDVKFKIQTQVWYGKNLNQINQKTSKSKIDSVDLGVVLGDGVCTVGEVSCENDTPYTLVGSANNEKINRTIKISGLDKSFTITAQDAWVFKDNEKEHHYFNSTWRFTPGNSYKVLEIGPTREYVGNGSRMIDGKTYVTVKNVRRFKVEYGNVSAWAYSFWGVPTGKISLKLEPLPPTTCEKNEYCVGSNCKYDETKCPIHPSKLKKVTCTKKQEKKTCDSVKYGKTQCDTTVTNSNYYYRISAKEFNEKFGASLSSSEKEVKHVGDFYYFPVKFSANVSYFQNAKLVVGGSSDSDRFTNGKVVTSGLNFSYSYKYMVSSSWNYKDGFSSYKLNTSNNNTFVFSKMYITSEKKRKEVQILVFLGEGDQLYTRDKKGVFHLSYKYNLDSLKIIISNSAKRNALDSVDKDKKNKVTFDNSNDASSKTRNSSAGSFSCSSPSLSKSEWGAGKVRSSTCTYWIKKAFFSNRMNGNIIYRNSNSVSGYYVDPNNKDGSKSWYYIPTNLKTGDSFTFKVSNPNLSLINKIAFTYNATCSVKGKNVIHDNNKVKYRSIDTSNPFPKVEDKLNYSAYPKNWQQYVKDKGLNRIVSNSFNGISYQTNFFKNKTYIDSLKTKYGDYYSYNDMDINGNGTSAIIHKNEKNLFSKINGNHNRAGEYKESKDKVQS